MGHEPAEGLKRLSRETRRQFSIGIRAQHAPAMLHVTKPLSCHLKNAAAAEA